jgi:hypothetical protein
MNAVTLAVLRSLLKAKEVALVDYQSWLGRQLATELIVGRQ